GLREFIAAVQNETGHAFVDEAITAARNALFAELNERLSIPKVIEVYIDYRAGPWKIDRLKEENPHPSGQVEHLLFRLCRLRDADLKPDTIYRILTISDRNRV